MMIFLVASLPLAGGGLELILTKNKLRNAVLFGIALAHLVCVAGFWLSPPAVINPFLGLDSFGLIILTIVSILFFAVSIYAPGYVANEKGRSNRIFTACLLFLLFAMTLVTVSQHLGLFWVAIGATTLMSAPLVYFHHRPQTLEATWKYLVIGSVGIALALLGTFFLAISAIQIKSSLVLNDLLNGAAFLSVPWLKVGVVFLVVGYGTKMGLVPMHSWKPDTYGEAPGPVGALLAGGITNCAFLAFLRISQICHAAHQDDFLKPILLVLGILSIAFASFFMLEQMDFNRLLAYSSIEHMGILILGLGLGGLGLYGSLFHAVNNAFSKGLIFLVSASLYQRYGNKHVKDIQGVLRTFPFTGGLLIAAFLAVTGIPPFGTFFSEFMILNAALASRHYAIAFFYLFFLSIVFIAMASVILKMARGIPKEGNGAGPQNESWVSIISPLFLTGIALFLGLYMPSFLDQALKKSSVLLGG